ncbi:MAG: hypothetical protein QF682_04940 [Candidatus Thermoplasmatota archaeon]|jgi:hypothetical protein|nr:hypothetical protein [Candidatus Thermoplasmatota archaeon]MDP7420745.1 hypothetical protein [bacterium]
MTEPRNIGQDFYAEMGKLERSMAALTMMRDDIRDEIDLPENLDDEISSMEDLFVDRQYKSAMEKSITVRKILDKYYLRMAREKAKNPAMDDVEEHMAEMKLFMEEFRRKKETVEHLENQYKEMLAEAEKKNPKGFFEKASKLRRELIYYDDMEALKNYLQPLIKEIALLKKEGVYVQNMVNALKDARVKMKEYNVAEAMRLAERVPLMLDGLKDVFTDATDKLARSVDKIDLAEKRGINTLPIGGMLVKAEKYYKKGMYNKSNKTLAILHEELDTLLRDQLRLEELLPPLQHNVKELFSWEPELAPLSRDYEELKKEVANGNVSNAASLAVSLDELVRDMMKYYQEISKLLPVAKRRFSEAKGGTVDVSSARNMFKKASDAMDSGDFQYALEMIKKSIKELLILQGND